MPRNKKVSCARGGMECVGKRTSELGHNKTQELPERRMPELQCDKLRSTQRAWQKAKHKETLSNCLLLHGLAHQLADGSRRETFLPCSMGGCLAVIRSRGETWLLRWLLCGRAAMFVRWVCIRQKPLAA